MKRVIFTTYDDINDKDDQWSIHSFQQNQIKDYYDKLVSNKENYANSIGVDFKLFRNTMKDFEVKDDMEFTKVNLYKHHLFATLAEEYDEVMYVDMDVVFNTQDNVFEEFDLSNGIAIKYDDNLIVSKVNEEVLVKEIGKRSPTLKYHITKDLLDGADCHVMNTGIMIGKKEHIQQIKYMKRLSDIADKILYIKDNAVSSGNASFLRMFYYPNNESIFSYILEEYNIPYQLMPEEWHTQISDEPKEIDWNKIKCAHFINKKFNAFFNDKTKCIYSIYIEIPDDKLDNPKGPNDDTVGKSQRTKERLAKYKDKLIQQQKDYANNVGAEYILFGDDDQFKSFTKRFPDLSIYDIINLYKVYLLDKLTYDYDLVLYVDLDVYFAKQTDVFNYMRAEHCFACQVCDAAETGIPEINLTKYFKTYNRDFRSPHTKYWNSHALLVEEGLPGDNYVFNTGIMMASRKVMEQINYFSDIEEVIETMKELKEFSMYPELVQKAFGYDNETIMSYKTKKNNVPLHRLPLYFHWIHDYTGLKSFYSENPQFKTAQSLLESNIKKHNIHLVHFISKNFGLVFDK